MDRRRQTVLNSCHPAIFFGWVIATVFACAQAALGQLPTPDDPRDERQLQEEFGRVDQYLSKMDLVDQQIVLRERYLNNAISDKLRKEILESASRLYATQLMKYADDDARSKHYLGKVKSFLDENPAADTPELQVMLLQADYNKAEAAATRWLNDPTDQASHKAAIDVLITICPKFLSYHRLISKRVEEEYERIDALPSGAERERRLDENNKLEGVIGRSAFFGAWSHYYLSVLRGQTAPPKLAEIAVDLFRELLDLKVDPDATLPWFDQADPTRMGLEQEWRARALIGLAMSEILQDDLPDARRCFALLESGPTSAEIVDEADYWYVRGLLNAGKLNEAASFAKTSVKELGGSTSPGKTSLCVLLADTGLRESKNNAAFKEVGIQGLVGLAKLGHHSAAIQLLEKYQVAVDSASGFYMQWLIGQKKFAEAENTKAEADYRAAQSDLRGALSAPEASQDLGSASECRYTLAWCCYRLSEFAEAGQNFQDAVAGLKANNASKAAESAWMSFVSYQELAKDEPRYGLRAIEALEDLKRNFPQHEYAKKADYFIAKLQQSRGSMSSSIDQLEKIQPSDANYWAAKFDLCNLLRQQVDQTKDDDEKRALAKKIQSITNDLRSRLKPTSDPPERVSGVTRCLLNVADLARKDLLDGADFAKYVALAEKLLASVPDDDRAWVDFHYQSLLLARQQKQDAAVSQHAKWLLDNAAGSPYEQSALIIRALEIDRLVESTTSPGTALLQEGFDTYVRLLKHLGASPAKVQQSKNSKVACSKAASFGERLGKWSEAASYLRVLVEAYPKEQEYLQRLGRAEFQLGNYADSVEHWRTLLAGLDKSSDAWLEAKYYQLSCLKEADPAQAKKVLEQFRLLHPSWGSPPWRDKIKTVADQIAKLN